MSVHTVVMPESVFTYVGRRYDIPMFAETYCKGDQDEAMQLVQILVTQGRAKLEIQQSKEQKVFEAAAKQQQWVDEANQHDTFVEQHKDFNANQKREGRATYPQVDFSYPNLLKAQEHQNMFHQSLRLAPDQSKIELTPGEVKLIFFEITDAELNAIQRIYKSDKAVSAILGGMEKGTGMVTDTTGYVATKVIAPAAQIGAKAGVSLLRHLAHTAIKVGGSVVTATSQGIKQTAYDVRHDADVLRAGRELLEVKDSTMRAIGKGGNRSGSGITIHQ